MKLTSLTEYSANGVKEHKITDANRSQWENKLLGMMHTLVHITNKVAVYKLSTTGGADATKGTGDSWYIATWNREDDYWNGVTYKVEAVAPTDEPTSVDLKSLDDLWAWAKAQPTDIIIKFDDIGRPYLLRYNDYLE